MRKKSAGAKKKKRERVWGGEKGGFARRFFSYLTPFYAFSPTAEPGPRLSQG